MYDAQAPIGCCFNSVILTLCCVSLIFVGFRETAYKAPIVYRLTKAPLLENILIIPSYFKIEILTERIL